jgi:hypothetical protein
MKKPRPERPGLSFAEARNSGQSPRESFQAECSAGVNGASRRKARTALSGCSLIGSLNMAKHDRCWRDKRGQMKKRIVRLMGPT